MRTYHIFVSHSWSYGKNYDSLINKLKETRYFDFKDYSVPRDNPIHNAANAVELENAIEAQIKYGSVVLILAGVYSTYSKWINKEIEIAKRLNKPIIAIEPFASEKTSQIVKNSAHEIVKWNSSSIVAAIKKYSL